jgi:hypothetical protein
MTEEVDTGVDMGVHTVRSAWHCAFLGRVKGYGGGSCGVRYLDMSSDSLTRGSQAVERAEIRACYSWVTNVLLDDLQSGRIKNRVRVVKSVSEWRDSRHEVMWWGRDYTVGQCEFYTAASGWY